MSEIDDFLLRGIARSPRCGFEVQISSICVIYTSPWELLDPVLCAVMLCGIGQRLSANREATVADV